MESERILGQNHILRHFENAIRMGKISHAYIINGEEGSGKMNLAIHFAKALQCERNNFNKAINENGERITVPGTACGQCKSCKQTYSKNQPDIKYITYEKSGIGVDEIREQINDDIDIKPYSSPYKIYIVPESEKMTVQAQNALLKTIEEPPEYAIIILLTTNADTFLQTILSRCVMLNIRPNGNPGKAIKLATSEEFKELKQYVVGMFMSLEKGGMDIIGEAIKKTGTFKKQIDEYFSLMRIWFRDILVYKATKEEDQIIFQDEYMTIEKMSQTYSFDDINDILKAIDLAESRIKSNVNFDSTIEILLLSIKEKTSGK